MGNNGEIPNNKEETQVKPEIVDFDTDDIKDLLSCIKVICVDLYGTLIYSEKNDSHLRLIKKFKNRGKNLIKYLRDIQIKERKKIRRSNDPETKEAISEINKHFSEQANSTYPYPDALDTIQELKNRGYKLVLISNLSEEFEAPLKKYFPKNLFNHKILSFKVGKRKPDTTIFKKALKTVNKKNKKSKNSTKYAMENMVMVGDTRKNDVKGPNDAGMKGILLDRNADKMYYDEKRNCIVIHTLNDLLDIFK